MRISQRLVMIVFYYVYTASKNDFKQKDHAALYKLSKIHGNAVKLS